MSTIEKQIDDLKALLGKTRKPSNSGPSAATMAAHRLAMAKSAAIAKELKARKPVKAITAAEFTGTAIRMSRDEFRKLSPGDKARFLKDGGTIA